MMEKTLSFKFGDRVRVVEDKDAKSVWKELHRGVVLKTTNSFVQVFDKDSSYDFFYSAEFFPISGKCIKTVKW